VETPTFDALGIVKGRIELNNGGNWGTIRLSASTEHAFGDSEALVACRQLGDELDYTTISGFKWDYWNVPDGTIDCILDDLNCDGTELSLGQCLTSGSFVCEKGKKRQEWIQYPDNVNC